MIEVLETGIATEKQMYWRRDYVLQIWMGNVLVNT